VITTTPLVRRAGVAVATLGGLALAGSALFAASAVLPFPPRLDPASLGAWAEQVGAPTVAFTALRALALALVGWFALAWALGVAARLVRRPGAVRMLDRASLPVVRRLADAAAGLAVIGATLTPGVAAAASVSTAPDTRDGAVVMTDLGPAVDTDSTTTSPTTEVPLPTTSTTATTVTPQTTTTSAAAAGAGAAPTPAPELEAGGTFRPGADRPSASTAPHPGSIWVIAPGDTLWHVAESTLATELGRPPTPAEIVERLERLVAANQDRLAVPDDPGLVFPGQEFVVA
jgi:hypothetical protein